MAHCTQCGKPTKPGAVFCGSCGAHLGDSSKCIKCGKKLKEGSKFCDNCGAATVSAPKGAARSGEKPTGKDLAIALLLAIIPGLGLIYLENTKKGVVIFIGVVLVGVIATALALIPVIGMLFAVLGNLPTLAIYIFNFVETYQEYQGKPIWKF
ncbi:MAG: zinc ribbon domain-containing protein [Candidatus Micrarchaeia archaeon]